MATPTITTSDPRGIGYQQGLFSAPLGTPIGQAFFDAAFAGRINPNPIYKETYNCDIIGQCGISQWLDEFMDVETDCYPHYTLLETYSKRQQIKVKTGVTIAAYPATSTIALSTMDHFVSGTYVLPQVGNSLVLPPNGAIADITAVTHATGNDTTLTVRLRSGVSGTVVLNAGDEAFVLAGSFIADCACPTGQFALEDLPTERDLNMIHWGDKGELCGDAIDKCQWLKINFSDEAGNIVDQRWWNEPLKRMYQRMEDRKTKETLFNDNFGIIPTVKALGLLFTPASTTEITLTDIRAWVAKLDFNGILCKEYAIFAGTNKYSQWMQMIDASAVARLNYIEQPNSDCRYLNLDWCGIKVEGLTLHIYKECSFSNGRELGGVSWTFPNSMLWVPMCGNNNTVSKTSTGGQTPRGSGYKNKMFTRVYFRSAATGEVFDMLTNSNGILNGPNGRNTFGTGCRNHEWTAETRWLQEIHCPGAWGYTGFGS